MTQDTKPFITV